MGVVKLNIIQSKQFIILYLVHWMKNLAIHYIKVISQWRTQWYLLIVVAFLATTVLVVLYCTVLSTHNNSKEQRQKWYSRTQTNGGHPQTRKHTAPQTFISFWCIWRRRKKPKEHDIQTRSNDDDILHLWSQHSLSQCIDVSSMVAA